MLLDKTIFHFTEEELQEMGIKLDGNTYSAPSESIKVTENEIKSSGQKEVVNFGLTDDSYDRYASSHAFLTIVIWVITGIFYFVFKSSIFSLAFILYIFPGIFVGSICIAMPTFIILWIMQHLLGLTHNSRSPMRNYQGISIWLNWAAYIIALSTTVYGCVFFARLSNFYFG